jgi:glycosyltransferase involved in cell wall biosynthesis
MFSLHIDTARTWRGGQNQVLLTVNGLREIGHRAALVAHSHGELRRRAEEGLDLIPLAPRSEVDLSAAWKLSRVIKQLAPDVIHAHDPHGIAMASLALSLGSAALDKAEPVFIASRRVDFHLNKNSFSRWKHRQVDCFVAASEAIRQMLIADGVPDDRTVTVHEGIDLEHVLAAPAVNVHEAFWLPHGAPVVGNVAALVPHKGQFRMPGSWSSEKGNSESSSSGKSATTISKSTFCCQDSGPMSLDASKASTSSP